MEFFLEKYSPTPIVVPWSGADFFEVNKTPDRAAYIEKWPVSASESRPTANTIVESFLVTEATRLDRYCETLSIVFRAMDAVGLSDKKDLENKRTKRDFLLTIRSLANDDLIPWIDATAILASSDKPDFNNLLGSGGGSDGNSHFSDNFMQCLWCVLREFEFQRKKPIAAVGGPFNPQKAIWSSLFRSSSQQTLLKNLSPALFNSQAVGGANSTTGYWADAASNPWDYILMIEGTLSFAGALSRKVGSAIPSEAMFPFLFRLSAIGLGSLIQGEASARGKEAWLPIWSHAASFAEISSLFSESRVLVGRRHAANGVDVARALASVGTDRGIYEFQRIGLIRGRVGGDNYFTSVDLGRFRPQRNHAVDILEEIDTWLDRFRRAANSKNAPAQAGRALRRIETAILELCQRGAKRNAHDVLIALGEAEAAVSISSKLRDPKDGKNKVDPIPSLTSEWLEQAYRDGDVEFRLAAALASIGCEEGETVGPLRRHLESVDVLSLNFRFPKWSKTAHDPNVVWGHGGLVRNLIAVLQRRLIEALRHGKQKNHDVLLFPGTGRYNASLGDITAFINGDVDDSRIEALLRGLILINWRYIGKDVLRQLAGDLKPTPDAAYALLKLCHLSGKLGDKDVPLQPAIIRRAVAGDLAAASRLATRRLRGSGFSPAVDVVMCRGERAARIAAALMFPVSMFDANRLAQTVLRPKADDPSPSETAESVETTD